MPSHTSQAARSTSTESVKQQLGQEYRSLGERKKEIRRAIGIVKLEEKPKPEGESSRKSYRKDNEGDFDSLTFVGNVTHTEEERWI